MLATEPYEKGSTNLNSIQFVLYSNVVLSVSIETCIKVFVRPPHYPPCDSITPWLKPEGELKVEQWAIPYKQIHKIRLCYEYEHGLTQVFWHLFLLFKVSYSRLMNEE